MKNKFYENILDYGLEIIGEEEAVEVKEEKVVEEYNDALWKGQPFQGVKIFHSSQSGQILFSIFMMALFAGTIAGVLSTIVFLIISSYEYFFNTFIVLFVIVIFCFIIIDIQDYRFRQKNKYWVITKGIIFRRGRKFKIDYLLSWDKIESMTLDVNNFIIYFDTFQAIEMKLVSPTDRTHKLHIETQTEESFENLRKVLKRFIKKEYHVM